MIELTSVSFHYGEETESEGKEKRNGIQDISLSIPKGEFVVLTGESGCGKTTLSRVLNGLCPKFYEGILSGSYQLDGQDSQKLSIDEIGQKIGSVFQDPRSQFFATNTTDEIVLAMENRTYSREQMEERLHEVAELLDMKKLLDRDMFYLSSGEKQKVAIASACTVKPDILILDEPSANLDLVSTEKLHSVLQVLKEEGYTILVLEHRLYYLQDLIDRMLILKDGRILKDYKKEEFRRLTDEKLESYGLRCLEVKPFNRKPIEKQTNKPYVSMQHIQFQAKGRKILTDVNLEIQKGEIIALTGKNGAGKTTTCKILSGLQKETEGVVTFGGESFKTKKRTGQCFFVQQDADYQLYAPSVYEEVTLNLSKKNFDPNEVQDILEKMNLVEYQDRHPGSLSGGQKQRVLLAAGILQKRPLLILDEPTSGLDGRHMRQMAQILREQSANGVAVLLITHDMEFIRLVADSVVEIQDGKTSEKQKVIREE